MAPIGREEDAQDDLRRLPAGKARGWLVAWPWKHVPDAAGRMANAEFVQPTPQVSTPFRLADIRAMNLQDPLDRRQHRQALGRLVSEERVEPDPGGLLPGGKIPVESNGPEHAFESYQRSAGHGRRHDPELPDLIEGYPHISGRINADGSISVNEAPPLWMVGNKPIATGSSSLLGIPWVDDRDLGWMKVGHIASDDRHAVDQSCGCDECITIRA